jgi:hypothetical protein
VFVSKIESNRRILIRIATSLMVLIIGPSAAWAAMQLEGIVIYALVITYSKTIVAEIVAKSQEKSIIAYRYSPLILSLSGGVSILSDVWYVPVIIVPLLLGSFVGAYWNLFHALRNLYDIPVEEFQRNEIGATVSAAILIILLKQIDIYHYATFLGVLLPIISFIAPMAKESTSSVLGKLTLEITSESHYQAHLITGSYGIFSLLSTWCMRIFTLSVGGVTALASYIAIAQVIGHLAKAKINVKAKDTDLHNWILGNRICQSGLIIMSIGVLYLNPLIFGLGFFIKTAGSTGFLRPLEVKFSEKLLTGEGGGLGVRERMKFKTQSKFITILVTSFYFAKESNINLEILTLSYNQQILIILLGISFVASLLNIRILSHGNSHLYSRDMG